MKKENKQDILNQSWWNRYQLSLYFIFPGVIIFVAFVFVAVIVVLKGFLPNQFNTPWESDVSSIGSGITIFLWGLWILKKLIQKAVNVIRS